MRLVGFLFRVCLVLCSATRSLDGIAAVNTSDIAAEQTPIEFPIPNVDLYSVPHFGFYFLGPDDQAARAVPGQKNPFYDPSKPTLIYFHGWAIGELSRSLPRSFNKHQRFPEAPDLDLVKLWSDRGWNVGWMDWTQFADTRFETGLVGALPAQVAYAAAERKIWARDGSDQLVYHLSDGSPHSAPEDSVADIMAKEYFNFMNEVAKTGPEVRFYGHSLGAQMAITVADRLSRMGSAEAPLNAAMLPSRVSLSDITSSNCPHAWLPSLSTHDTTFSPLCVGRHNGDWIGERLANAVEYLKHTTKNVAFDAYRCWGVSSSGVFADRDAQLLKKMVVTEMKPNVPLTKLFVKHVFCMWTYLASVAAPPPLVVSKGIATAFASTDEAAPTCAALSAADGDRRGVSASTPTKRVLQLMNGNVHFVQTKASVGPDIDRYTVACKPK